MAATAEYSVGEVAAITAMYRSGSEERWETVEPTAAGLDLAAEGAEPSL